MAAPGPRSITVSWVEPETTNGNIIHYLLNITRDAELVNTSLVVMGTNFTASSLTPFTNYTFEVAGMTRAGAGMSATLTVSTQQDGNVGWEVCRLLSYTDCLCTFSSLCSKEFHDLKSKWIFTHTLSCMGRTRHHQWCHH